MNSVNGCCPSLPAGTVMARSYDVCILNVCVCMCVCVCVLTVFVFPSLNGTFGDSNANFVHIKLF